MCYLSAVNPQNQVSQKNSPSDGAACPVGVPAGPGTSPPLPAVSEACRLLACLIPVQPCKVLGILRGKSYIAKIWLAYQGGGVDSGQFRGQIATGSVLCMFC